MDHKYKIKSFLFFLIATDFLKILIDLAFLIPTLSLFHSFIQYGKNVLLKDFALVGIGLIMRLMMVLVNNFLEKRNLDKNSRVVNDLPFYKKKTNLLRQRFLTNECKPNSSQSLEVPYIPPVIARQAIYCTFSILF